MHKSPRVLRGSRQRRSRPSRPSVKVKAGAVPAVRVVRVSTQVIARGAQAGIAKPPRVEPPEVVSRLLDKAFVNKAVTKLLAPAIPPVKAECAKADQQLGQKPS